MSITKEQQDSIIKEFAKDAKDTGSVEVQVAIMTQRIKNLTEHMKMHKKDFATKKGLLKMVATRRKFLKYLKTKDLSRYTSLLEKLGLKPIK